MQSHHTGTPSGAAASGPFSNRSTRILSLAAAVLLGTTATACQQESARAGDDSGSEAPVQLEAVIQDAAPSGTAGSARGILVGNFIVSIYSEEGYWVDLGREAELTVPLRDPSGARPFRVTNDVPPGTYTRVRVLLCHSSVDVESGSRIADLAVESDANVHITETGDVIVEREVEPIRIGSGDPVRLDVDLNTPAWLTPEAVTSGEADIPTLEQSVQVTVRDVSAAS